MIYDRDFWESTGGDVDQIRHVDIPDIDPAYSSGNSVSDWRATNCILTICGDHVSMREFHEKPVWYGGTRNRLKQEGDRVVKRQLGRSSTASPEQHQVNALRRLKAVNRRVRERGECNEWQCDRFETLTPTGQYQDWGRAVQDRRLYFDRLERFVQTGKLYGKVVTSFTPKPEFVLKAHGVTQFQDGTRTYVNKAGTLTKGAGTGNLHFHHFHNCPYLPQVWAVMVKARDEHGAFCAHYLGYTKARGYFWEKAAGRHTVWFDTERGALDFLKPQHRPSLPGSTSLPAPKRLCVNQLLWGRGHTDIKKLQDLRNRGQCASAGEYLCHYISPESVDGRFANRRMDYTRGPLEKPEVYRDFAMIQEVIQVLNLWEFLTHQHEFIAPYVGAMTIYFFNLWVAVYPWMRRVKELKQQRKRMTRADWIACGVDEGSFPLLE